VSEAAAPPVDPGSLVRSKSYRVLLVFAAVIGVVVSVASWGFLELIHGIQQWVYKDLPSGLGFDTVPMWWPLPVLGLAGVIIAFAIARLPGWGGHRPAEGLKAGPPTKPIELPGVLLAALASISLGMVLGPEAPLIALGTGLAIFAVRLARKDAPDQVLALMAAAASFAAISSLFGSPVVGAVIIIEAAGLGGSTLPVVLLPGLIAAGIGSLVFIGMGSLTGLSTSAYAIAPLSLPAYREPNLAAFAWIIVLAIAVAVVAFVIMAHPGSPWVTACLLTVG
jgi:H+/Cl- antiporter ClcA